MAMMTLKEPNARSAYLALGPGRSLAKLRGKFGENSGRAPAMSTLEKWSSERGWVKLAQWRPDARMTILKNPRQERFAQELAMGKTADQAYQSAGYKPDRGHASRLASNGNIRGRLAEIQDVAAKEATVTIADIVRQLDADRQLAMRRGLASAMVSATMGKAKVLGLIVDRSVQVLKRLEDMTEDELRHLLGECA